MSVQNKVTVIIPSLNPDEKLMKVVCGLEELGFDSIIVVNDGSSADKISNFPSNEDHPSCTVLTHEVNRGKGAALKTAFKYFLQNPNGREGVITVDGDNQHRPEDVKKCAEMMLETKNLVLGVRDFSLPHVPPRSRFGNKVTSFIFRIGCGMKISDTQTGLRAFPLEILPAMLEISGDRFEYETNMLLELKNCGIKLSEQPIETVYIEENQTSHFRPIVDSIRIYSLILKFLGSAVISALTDLAVFYLFLEFAGEYLGSFAIMVSTVVARLISSALNFSINRNKVFGNTGDIKKTLPRYYTLAAVILAISMGAVWGLDTLTGNSLPILTTLIKAAVDVILFVLSFRVQREWVFSKKK